LTHLHKTQKHSITTTHSLPRASRATVFQNLLNRYAGAKYICFGDALGQNVKSAPRYLPVARRHQKNLFSSYLHLTPFDISPRWSSYSTWVKAAVHLSEAASSP